MTRLIWDATGERVYQTGLDHGVLYLPDGAGAYVNGYRWNGLTKVSEKPTGATSTKQYADNIIYLNLLSLEQFEADISAYTYPDEWAECDGTKEPEPGVAIGQQPRKSFGLSYRTKVGDDLHGSDNGYKLHLVYNALAAPSSKDFTTVNDSPAALEFTWSMTCTPVTVTGYKALSTITIDSTKVSATALAILEDFLYGTVGSDPSLPTPDAVLAIFAGTVTSVTPTMPTFNAGTHTMTIPTITGVTYYNAAGVAYAPGGVVIAVDTFVTARPNTGYKFPASADRDWTIVYS